jgi:hypothetical protein
MPETADAVWRFLDLDQASLCGARTSGGLNTSRHISVGCVTIEPGSGGIYFQHASNANAVVGLDVAHIGLVGTFGGV